jgi:hypothetical protein
LSFSMLSTLFSRTARSGLHVLYPFGYCVPIGLAFMDSSVRISFLSWEAIDSFIFASFLDVSLLRLYLFWHNCHLSHFFL